MLIKELEKGENIINLMLKSVQQKEGAKGSYLDILMTDGKQDIEVKRWDSRLSDFKAEPGAVINVKVNVGEYKSKPNYVMVGYRDAAAGSYVQSEFIRSAPLDANFMYEEIIKQAYQFTNVFLKELVTEIYENHKEKLLHWSAAKSVHHNMVGGLLYHTYRMVLSAEAVSRVYTAANHDMLLAGVMLHDVGKLFEMDTDTFGNTVYTVDGNLFGHLLIGADIIKESAGKLGTPDEIVRQLRHIIISHHGKLEFDAIKVPCTLEAMLVHEIDLMDARVYQFEKIADSQERGTVSEQGYYALNGAHVYVPAIENQDI